MNIDAQESRFLLYFFDVPVYRLGQEEHSRQSERFTSAFLSRMPNHKAMFARDPSLEINTLSWLHRKFGGSWTYNEIIGYIRLHFLGSQVRGDYVGQRSARLYRNGKKQFEHITHKLAPEVNIPSGASSEQIFRIIKLYIESCKKEQPRRYIDTELLDTIGPFVDWRRMYQRAY